MLEYHQHVECLSLNQNQLLHINCNILMFVIKIVLQIEQVVIIVLAQMVLNGVKILNRKTYHDKKFKAKDIMTMILHLNQKHLSFYHNNTSLGIAYHNIDVDEKIIYKFAVIMATNTDELDLSDFEFKYKDKYTNYNRKYGTGTQDRVAMNINQAKQVDKYCIILWFILCIKCCARISKIGNYHA